MMLIPRRPAWVLLTTVWFVTRHRGSQLCSHRCPQARPTCSQRCRGQTDTRAADMVAHFAHFPLSPLSLPWVILPGNAAHAPHISFVCAPSYRLRYQHNQSSCSWAVSYFVHLPLTHNVYSHVSAPAMAAGVSILSDLPYSAGDAGSGDISTEMETGKKALQHKHNTWFICYEKICYLCSWILGLL